MYLKEHPNRKIIRVSLQHDGNGRYYGVVLVKWANIDPEEYVVWSCGSNDHEMALDTVHGTYVIGRDEAEKVFARRAYTHGIGAKVDA